MKFLWMDIKRSFATSGFFAGIFGLGALLMYNFITESFHSGSPYYAIVNILATSGFTVFLPVFPVLGYAACFCGEYESGYSDWVREQTAAYNRNRAGNPGRKKYQAKKRRFTERMHSYINQELNRLFEEEKPRIIYVAKLPKPQAAGKNRRVNQKVSMWQRGYIRGRLHQKCREQSVVFVEVFGKGISAECYRCGGNGEKKEGIFVCGSCGYETEEKRNAAQNAKKRGMEGDGRGA